MMTVFFVILFLFAARWMFLLSDVMSRKSMYNIGILPQKAADIALIARVLGFAFLYISVIVILLGVIRWN